MFHIHIKWILLLLLGFFEFVYIFCFLNFKLYNVV